MVECMDKTLYTGITTDLNRRVNEHNSSEKGAKYTKTRRPVYVVYFECVADRSEASKREIAIKKMSRKNKETMVENFLGLQKD